MKLEELIKKELILEIIIFFVGMLSISLFYKDNLLLFVLLMLYWVVGIRFWHKRHDVYFYITGAIIGSIGEIVCIHFGVWIYVNPTLFGIPIWLPLAWGLFTMLIKRVAETFVRIEMK